MNHKEASSKKEVRFSKATDTPRRKEANSSFSSSTVLPKPAFVSAELCGFNFACRTDSGADDNVISDSIITFLGYHGIFLPTLRYSKEKSFQAVNGHDVKPTGKVQLSPTFKTVAGPWRLRNVAAHIMQLSEKFVIDGSVCSGEIVLENPLLVLSRLDVKDFISKNIEHLFTLDFGYLYEDDSPSSFGKLGKSLLSLIPDNEDSSRVSSIFSNRYFPRNDGDDIDYKDVDIGEQDEKYLSEFMNEAVVRSVNHLPTSFHEELRRLFSNIRTFSEPNLEMLPQLIYRQ